jgi:phosphoenolpyruvate synthase/pyruvate phosphate dikinase
MKIFNLTKSDTKVDKKLIGGKSLPILEMNKNKIPVPISYGIGHNFFTNHLLNIGFWDKINFDFNEKDLLKKIRLAKKVILKSDLSEDLKKELDIIDKNIKFWAVRSSANIEDSKNKSWAGGFESYIGVKRDKIEYYIKKVWASVFSERVLNYLDKPQDIKDIKMAILLQEAMDSDVSGVCFTADPFDDESDEIIIEAVHGIGEYLVQGEVVPDKYLFNKVDLFISEVNFNEQKKKLSFSNNGLLNKVENLNFKEQKLSGDKIVELSKMALKIENIYKEPRDIEWCYKGNRLYILQSRPITS